MGKYSEVFVAFDVAKKKHAVAIAEGGRTGEVRFMGDVENNPAREWSGARGTAVATTRARNVLFTPAADPRSSPAFASIDEWLAFVLLRVTA